jgi:dTDP-4-dehydrorhamnose 3,5-epimerase
MKTIKNKIKSDKIKDLEIIKLDIFEDSRGQIWTIYSEEHSGLNYVADKITISNHGVLRGLHGDPYTSKLITCLSGKFQLAVVDVRKDSETYGNVETFTISEEDPTVVFVPAGCVNAHLCVSDRCVFYYKWSEEYNGPESQVTVAWDDPELNIDWAIKNPILSERDKNGVSHKKIKL